VNPEASGITNPDTGPLLFWFLFSSSFPWPTTVDHYHKTAKNKVEGGNARRENNRMR